ESAAKRLLQYETNKSTLTAEQLSYAAPAAASMYASIDQFDDARRVLREALPTARGEPSETGEASPESQLLLSIMQVDQQYDLGLAESEGIDPRALVMAWPQA